MLFGELRERLSPWVSWYPRPALGDLGATVLRGTWGLSLSLPKQVSHAPDLMTWNISLGRGQCNLLLCPQAWSTQRCLTKRLLWMVCPGLVPHTTYTTVLSYPLRATFPTLSTVLGTQGLLNNIWLMNEEIITFTEFNKKWEKTNWKQRWFHHFW